MIPGLEAKLAELALAGETVTYGALARALGLTGPGSIARLTAALEALMEEDAAQGRPFRAALCAGRLAGGLPAQGFFLKARALGADDGGDPQGLVAAHRARLRQPRTD